MTGLSFLQGFPHAKDGSEIMLQGGFQLFVDLGIGFP
jgi:hypothetical protein